MKVAELFVKALENEGVEYVFGVPGEENLDLLDALRQSTQITFVLTRHEQAAGFMAATVGRLTGKPGVALSTLGPGATNLMTATAYSQLGAMPALFITGQKPIRKSKQGRFQIIDAVSMFRPLTKFSHQIVNGSNTAVHVREAFKQAVTERPGAVHLELPEDVAAEEVLEEQAVALPYERLRRPIPEDKAIARAVTMLEAAKHPVIVVGAGSNRKQVRKMLTAFIEKTNIPFVATQMGKGVVNENLSSYLGTATLSKGDAVHEAIDCADLIINIGHDVIEKPPFIMRPTDTRQVIHMDFSPAVVDAIYFPHHEVIGDIGNALWQLGEKITTQSTWDMTPFSSAREQTEQYLQAIPPHTKVPLAPQRIIQDIRATLSEKDIVTLDNGMYKLWFSRFYRTAHPNSLLLDNALATMGAGVPSAIAATLLRPDCTVVAVTGDGGFMMNSQELETAVRLKLHLIIVLLVDSGYGMIKWKQAADGFPAFGLDYGNPDFVAYAESYGATGYKVTTADDLAAQLATARDAGSGVHVIVTPIDYTDNQAMFGA